MLKLCEKYEELASFPEDPFCAKIRAYALTYGFSQNFIRFYRQESSAALCIIDGNITLYCDENADYEEIKSFLPFLGFSSIQTSLDTAGKLGLKIKKASYIVKYEGGIREKPDYFTDAFDGREVYALLNEAGFETGDYNAFIESICARLNRGTASFGGIKSGKLEACAFRLFEDEKSVLLGAVATRKESRGKGLASSLVPYIAHPEKQSFLFCREDSLLDFYKKCGFSPCDKWAESDEVIL